MRNPKVPCPYCPLLLLSRYYPHYNKLYCYEGHYESYWTKDDNQLMGELFYLGDYKIQNNYIALLQPASLIWRERGCKISKAPIGYLNIGTEIITLKEPLPKPITLKQILNLITFS